MHKDKEGFLNRYRSQDSIQHLKVINIPVVGIVIGREVVGLVAVVVGFVVVVAFVVVGAEVVGTVVGLAFDVVAVVFCDVVAGVV